MVTGKVMMLAILAEKKKKKKLNERCVLCSAQKYQRSNYLSLRMVIRIPGLGKFLLVESGIWEFFWRIRNPVLWNLEFSSVNWNLEILPSSKDKKSGINPVSGIEKEPHSRPFVWLLARTWIRKNTDCFAV